MSLASLAALAVAAGHQRVHELQRGRGSLRHLVLEFPRGIVREAEQLAPCRARSCARRAMVARVSLASPRSARVQEFSKSAWRVARSLELREIRLLRRVLQRNARSLPALRLLRRLRSSGELRVAQAGQCALVGGDVGAVLGRRPAAWSKMYLKASRASSFSFFSSVLVGVREICTGVHELVVSDLRAGAAIPDRASATRVRCTRR